MNSLRANAACRPDCQPRRCGDGVVDSLNSEACDEGPEVLDETGAYVSGNSDAAGAICRSSCLRSGCGDGIQDPGEECDLGSANADVAGAACRTDCTLPKCGDGVKDEGEECDAGKANPLSHRLRRLKSFRNRLMKSR